MTDEGVPFPSQVRPAAPDGRVHAGLRRIFGESSTVSATCVTPVFAYGRVWVHWGADGVSGDGEFPCPRVVGCRSGRRRFPTPRAHYAAYCASLNALGVHSRYFVLDGPGRRLPPACNARGEGPLTVVSLTRNFGEATTLMAGFEHARRDHLDAARLSPDRQQ
jgi:hypothetical protein